MEEYFFGCPYCWEKVSMLLDISVSCQSYIEDCEICCNPLEFTIEIHDNNLISFSVNSIEQ